VWVLSRERRIALERAVCDGRTRSKRRWGKAGQSRTRTAKALRTVDSRICRFAFPRRSEDSSVQHGTPQSLLGMNNHHERRPPSATRSQQHHTFISFEGSPPSLPTFFSSSPRVSFELTVGHRHGLAGNWLTKRDSTRFHAPRDPPPFRPDRRPAVRPSFFGPRQAPRSPPSSLCARQRLVHPSSHRATRPPRQLHLSLAVHGSCQWRSHLC
jgi:hypothetical protein